MYTSNLYKKDKLRLIFFVNLILIIIRIILILIIKMNMYTQIIYITLGGLLSVSEILPFIKNVKTNGIIHFLAMSLIKDVDEYEESHNTDIESESSLLINGLSNSNVSDNSKLNKEIYDLTKLLNMTNTSLMDNINKLNNIKTNYYEKEKVEDIVEMILQHLQDLQRVQSGLNNSDKERFENILDTIKEHLKDNLKEIKDTCKMNDESINTLRDVTVELNKDLYIVEEIKELTPEIISRALKSNMKGIRDEIEELCLNSNINYKDINNKIENVSSE